jgi:hypothetical protein
LHTVELKIDRVRKKYTIRVARNATLIPTKGIVLFPDNTLDIRGTLKKLFMKEYYSLSIAKNNLETINNLIS